MNKNSREKTRSLIGILLILMIGITGGYISSTYAKYISEITASPGVATVAKWKFSEDNQNQSITIDLTNTPDASTLVSGKIAPGTSGSFNIALSNANTETGVDFTVTVSSISNVPTNLKFYKDSNHTVELNSSNSTITGQLAAKETTTLYVPIYWAWGFGTSNDVNDTVNVADTADGSSAESLTIGVDIKGIQTPPSSTAIITHIN